MTRDDARIKFLDIMIPQLWDGGYDRIAAEYEVERDRLVAARNLRVTSG